MAETFVPEPGSSITQVTFWKSYSSFIKPDPSSPSHSSSSSIPPSGSAGQVIKSATTVFPGASAMVITTDESGAPLAQNIFVIHGLRFKRSVGGKHVFRCRWAGCPVQHSSQQTWTDGTGLLHHLVDTHLSTSTPCKWSTCKHTVPTFAHIATHIPPPINPSLEPSAIHHLVHPNASSGAESLTGPFVTFRPVPPLPPGVGDLSLIHI